MYPKGGVDVENFLIQEGVPTRLKTENEGPVEPVVYLVDGQAASWFYRVNEKKGDIENLNSPSAAFGVMPMWAIYTAKMPMVGML